MPNNSVSKHRLYQTRFSFGATSAIITILGLITGLDTLTRPTLSIIAGILVIALADNIADSLGIHVYQESEGLSNKEVWRSTSTNFLTRLFVSFTFILLLAALPMPLAVACSIIWGLTLLAVISYTIAKGRGVNPYVAVLEHVGIAILVIIGSHMVGGWLIRRF